MTGFVRSSLIAGLVGLACAQLSAAAVAPNLKVLLCTGDFGLYGQDRVPAIEQAVEKAAPGVVVWEAHQSYNMTRALESTNYVGRFDVIVIGDVAMGQLTTKAQQNIVDFVNRGGGLVWVAWFKGGSAYSGEEAAVPMPLKNILAVAYPNFHKIHPEATSVPASDPFFAGIDWAPLTDDWATNALPTLMSARTIGSGSSLCLQSALGDSWQYVSYAKYEKKAGSWGVFPQFGEVWIRVLNRAAAHSPVRTASLVSIDAAHPDQPLTATLAVDATKTVDDIRAGDFSIVALQQLYNEDGGKNEALFLALNPRDWFDRRSQEVLSNTNGVKSDKAAFFHDFNIRGIYMVPTAYGGFTTWNDATYASEIAKAIDAKKKWPEQLTYFQVGNEPPLDATYVAFHKRFVDAVLKEAPGYQVIGPNKAFNGAGVNPKEMDFYLAECGKTTDILNWHNYSQPPSTIVAEARYWCARATGKLRSPGPAKVMFTESDAWNQGPSQFNYLMERAYLLLAEPEIIANFQYCMDQRHEGGTYFFGVLQPEGVFEANYNGYWAWRNLRGKMVDSQLVTPAPQDSLRAISSISRDGKTVTTVVYYGLPVWGAHNRNEHAQLALNVQLPPGGWQLERSDTSWNKRQAQTGETVTGVAQVKADLASCTAVSFVWRKQGDR